LPLSIITQEVSDDEPCHGYCVREYNGNLVEWIFVIRGDAIAKYEHVFGPIEDYEHVPPLLMPSFGENKVGLMREFGEKHIHDYHWLRRRVEHLEASTIIEDAIRQREQMDAVIRNRSNFGPAQSTQRNGYSHITTWRNWNDERHRRTGKIQL